MSYQSPNNYYNYQNYVNSSYYYANPSYQAYSDSYAQNQSYYNYYGYYNATNSSVGHNEDVVVSSGALSTPVTVDTELAQQPSKKKFKKYGN